MGAEKASETSGTLPPPRPASKTPGQTTLSGIIRRKIPVLLICLSQLFPHAPVKIGNVSWPVARARKPCRSANQPLLLPRRSFKCKGCQPDVHASTALWVILWRVPCWLCIVYGVFVTFGIGGWLRLTRTDTRRKFNLMYDIYWYKLMIYGLY